MKNSISFTKQNYIIMLTGLLIVVIGFLLMSGGGSEDPTKFNYDIFSARRITLAPIMVIGGYVVVVVGIMKKSKASTNENKPTEELDLDS